MTAGNQRPVALTIAGSDSGGGAGIQADLKVFAALGVHGTSVVTAITAQNPKRVLAAEAVSPGMVRKQLQALFEEMPPVAVKTGMLHSAAVIRAVVDFLRDLEKRPPLVVDPVLISTSGSLLLDPAGLELLRKELLPLAALITPNIQEAEALTGHPVRDQDAMRQTAEELAQEFGISVLIKGGHLATHSVAPDVLYSNGKAISLEVRRIEGIGTHGTGCTLSASIAARLALGDGLERAACFGKDFITKAIADSYKAGGHWCLNVG